MAETNLTAGQKLASEVIAGIRSRVGLMLVVSPEEKRSERLITDAAAACGYPIRFVDTDLGCRDLNGAEVGPGAKVKGNPPAMLAAIRDSKERAIWVLRDFLPFCNSDPMLRRTLRNLAKSLPSSLPNESRAIVILSTSDKIHDDLADHTLVIRGKLPDRAEIAVIFDRAVKAAAAPPGKEATPEDVAKLAPNGTRGAAIEALIGLSAEAAADAISRCLVTQRPMRIVPALLAAEKRQVVGKATGIEWTEPDPRGMAAVGGLDPTKAWLDVRRKAFSEKARKYGLPMPKGLFLVGQPGCGKSLIAKAAAATWGVPLIRVDLGRVMGGVVGQSEKQMQDVFEVIEALGLCVVFFDEIEKYVASGSGSLDGGVQERQKGALLTWLQDRKCPAFVIATANDVKGLPPELLRKGRFDELFFVDFPTQVEREAIIRVTLAQYGQDAANVDVATAARRCAGYSGAEIADGVIRDALFAAFSDGERPVNTADLLAGAETLVPLSRTMAEVCDARRQWAKGRARAASLPEVAGEVQGTDRVLEFPQLQ